MNTKDTWKSFAGEIALPTIALNVCVVVGFIASSVCAALGLFPLWAAAIVNTVLGYLAFTCAHEAAHGNVNGQNPRLKWLNELVGWTSGIVLLAPFPAFRAIHLKHHCHTNDPVRDPDFWVAPTHIPRDQKVRWWLGVTFRCLTIIPHYYFDILVGDTSKTGAARKVRMQVILTASALFSVVAALMLAGFFSQVVSLWLFPTILASGLLAFAFDYLPHAPHTTRGRYVDTRVMIAPGLQVLMMWQNYHTVHHLWPRVPFYRYGQCFYATRELLEAKGTPISDGNRAIQRAVNHA